jgi:hypothetical protein
MSSGGRKKEQPKQADDNSKKRPAAPSDNESEDYEDGDIATPKRDRYGTDDEPL